METTKPRKAYRGPAMEGRVATWYAKNTLKDIHRHKLMAAQLAGKVPVGRRVLEVAPGPGYFCIELAKLGDFKITGLDISQSFVEICRKNAATAGVQAEFRQGDAAHMPFEAGSFDFIFCQAAFKNFSQPVQAIGEMYRVLSPGGLAVIVDLRRDAPWAEIEKEVAGMGLDPLNRFMTRWTFRLMLLKTAYSVDQIKAMVARTPFRKSHIDVSEIGFQLWLEK